jgi:glutamate racemase
MSSDPVAPTGLEDLIGLDGPIGMFDSGFGGLTVARAVIDLLPGEDLVYLGDTGRYPYGPRPLDEVLGFARQIAHRLVDEYEVKLVVVACNTAAAAALGALQDELSVPVVGVIEPGVRSVARATRSGRVGVIGTVGTIASGAYQRAAVELGSGIDLSCAACPGFVEFVERGETEGDQVRVLAERLLAPMVDAKVDTLLLGCTHYPFLARTIADVMGRDVVLVSSADETAFEVHDLLRQLGLHRPPFASGSVANASASDSCAARAPASAPASPRVGQHRFLSSGEVGWFRELGQRLLGPELSDVGSIRWS